MLLYFVRMLILENLISRFENKNSRDLVENSSRRRRQVAHVDLIKKIRFAAGGDAAAAAGRRRRVMTLKPAAVSS